MFELDVTVISKKVKKKKKKERTQKKTFTRVYAPGQNVKLS